MERDESYYHTRPEPPEQPRFCDQCMSYHPDTSPCSDDDYPGTMEGECADGST